MNNKKQITKKQHFVPVFYLNGFSLKDKVCLFRRKERFNTSFWERSESSPLSILYVKNLHELPSVTPNFYENKFASVEGLLSKHFESRHLFTLKDSVSEIIYCLFFQIERTPQAKDELIKLLTDAGLKEHIEAQTGFSLKSEEFMNIVVNQHYKYLNEHIQEYIAFFQHKWEKPKVVILPAAPGKSFGTSDFPVLQFYKGMLIKQRMIYFGADMFVFPINSDYVMLLGECKAIHYFLNIGSETPQGFLIPWTFNEDYTNGYTDRINMFTWCNAINNVIFSPTYELYALSTKSKIEKSTLLESRGSMQVTSLDDKNFVFERKYVSEFYVNSKSEISLMPEKIDWSQPLDPKFYKIFKEEPLKIKESLMTKDYETVENDHKEPGVIHHGGEVGKSAERLSDDSSTKEEQSQAGQDLAEHGNDPKLHPENS